jgi:feruloyl esterase
LIIWHGVYDPSPSPLGTLAYYESAVRTSAPKLGVSTASMTDRMRLFLAPGVAHCGGGPGPDRFDMLRALDEWVEHGKAPERITATKADAPISRPLCAYPAWARYRGEGDTNDAASFVCR